MTGKPRSCGNPCSTLIFTFHWFKCLSLVFIFFLMWLLILQRSFVLMCWSINILLAQTPSIIQIDWIEVWMNIQRKNPFKNRFERYGIFIWTLECQPKVTHFFADKMSKTFRFLLAVSISTSHCYSLFLNLNLQWANIMRFGSNIALNCRQVDSATGKHDFHFAHH